MKDDPIVDETRGAGEAYLAKFNFDLKVVCEDLRRQSEAAGRKTVSLPPRPVKSQVTEGRERDGIERGHHR